MIDLILVGMATAFILAALDPLLEVMSIFVNKMALTVFVSLGISLGANLLLGYSAINSLIVWTFAGAYLGSALVLVAEKLATYRPAVVNPTQ
jgi:hypothetical protein